jgi:hypothetical protein
LRERETGLRLGRGGVKETRGRGEGEHEEKNQQKTTLKTARKRIAFLLVAFLLQKPPTLN